MIKGIIQAVKTNDYGFTSLKVSGVWYGAEQKGKPPVAEGDLVEFEAFKNAKNYDTIRKGTLGKLEKTEEAVAALPAPVVNDRDKYWADKAKSDEAKEPRITYFAALDRAIAAADFYVRNGALPLEKVKATDKLKVLREFVDLEASRFVALAGTGGVVAAPAAQEPAEVEAEAEAEEVEQPVVKPVAKAAKKAAAVEEPGKW